MLRALIVDDEPPARDLLRRMLAVHADRVEIVGEARNVADAAEKCQRLRPEVVFLDVQMPREDGFALLPRFGPPTPAVIFVTAYDAFAVRAFEVNAVDYLLKPVVPERLARALARVTTPAIAPRAPRPTISASAVIPLHATDTVFLHSDRGIRIATVAAITHIEAEENYTRVHLTEGPAVLIRRTMVEWESVLPVDLFVRVERSLLINRAAIQRVDRISREVAHAHIAGRTAPLALARRASLRLRRSLKAHPLS